MINKICAEISSASTYSISHLRGVEYWEDKV